MIIRCEQCDTRFQLDDARIPEQGARVRCSLCKNAFFVRRPEASPEEAVHAVAAEAAEIAATDGVAGPSPAWDLDDAPAPPPARDVEPEPPETIAEPPEEEESDWEFEEPVPGGPTEAEVESAAPEPEPAPRAAPEPIPTGAEAPAPTPSGDETAVFSVALDGERGIFADEENEPENEPLVEAGAAPEACEAEAPSEEAEPAPEDSRETASLDAAPDAYYDLDGPDAAEGSEAQPATDAAGEEVETLAKDGAVEIGVLGDPSSWDLEGELEADGVLDGKSGDDGWSWDADSASESAPARVEAPVAPTGGLASLGTEQRGSPIPLAQLTGWGAVLALVMVGFFALVQSPSTALGPVVRAPAPAFEVAGLEIDGLEARPLDNLNVGPLWVVSGRARNPGSGERVLGTGLRVQALGADGASLAEAPAVPHIDAAVLRESHPAALSAAEPAGVRRLAQSILAPGEWLVFDAVLGALPAGAVGLSVTAAPLPEVSEPAAPVGSEAATDSGDAAS